MKINSIFPVYSQNINRNPFVKTSQFVLQSDVFTKSLNFCGNSVKNTDKSYSALEKWAGETDFLSKVEEIDHKTGKILGSGFEGTTYGIPETDNWVLKKYKRGNFVAIPLEKANLIEIDDIAPKLNIGQAVARVEIPAGSRYSYVYYVLKRQDGDSIGVPLSSADNLNERNINTHLKTLEQLANAPQETFDKCIKDIQYVTSQGYEFDAGNPYNFMFDSTKQHINFVDINDRHRDDSTQFGDVLYALLDGKFAQTLNNSDCDDAIKEKSTIFSNQIIEKFLYAMESNSVKFKGGRYFPQLLDSNALDNVLNSKNKDERVAELKARNLI